MSLLHRQPFKVVYIGLCALQLLFLLPIWSVLSFIPSCRPVPTWRPTRVLAVRLMHWILSLTFRTNILGREESDRISTQLPSASSGFFYVPKLTVDPPGQVGEWVKKTKTESSQVPAYWLGAANGNGEDHTAREGQSVMLYFHGGAYIFGTASPSDFSGYIPSQLCKLSTRMSLALSINYRLSSSAPNPTKYPFPAALVDAIASFEYLLSLGFKPSDIVISGDSAGGNIAQALTRHLIDNALGTPKALVLFSPWVDLSDSHDGSESSLQCNVPSDILPIQAGLAAYASRSFTGSVSPLNAYISPACKTLIPNPSFVGFPRTYLSVGSAEVLVDQVRTLKDRMQGQMEQGVTYDEVSGAMHDFCTLGFMEPERSKTIQKVAKWIDEE